MPALWDDMLDEFRALGGAAENVFPGEGSVGRGLFPLNPAKPVLLYVPESLLLPLTFVRWDEGELRVAADAPLGPRERQFLEMYERDFSWGVAHGDTEELLTLLEGVPAELRRLLEIPFQAHPWLAGANPQSVTERFFAARAVGYKGTAVVAPIIDLVNHGLGPLVQATDGVSLQGEFSDEVVTRYGPTDPIGIFNRWGFASSCEVFALSLGMGLKTTTGSIMMGRRNPVFTPGRNAFVPEVSITNGNITLSHLLLGHKRAPKLPRGIFYRLMQQAGRSDAEENFDQILHVNRTACHQLAAAAEDASPALRRLFRDVARYQLMAMSYNIGASEAV